MRGQAVRGRRIHNVDGYQNGTGFPLTGRDQLRYNAWLANAAHRAGLSAALKNDVGQVRTFEPYFDYALDEECFTYDECNKLTPFVDDGKAVFGVEYALARSEFCPDAKALGFDFMKKKLSLRAWRAVPAGNARGPRTPVRSSRPRSEEHR